jgi:hypothetical protein
MATRSSKSRPPIVALEEPEPFIKRNAKCPNNGCLFKGTYAEVIKHMSQCEPDNTEMTNLDDCESIIMSEATSTAFTDQSFLSKIDPRQSRKESETAMTYCILGCGELVQRGKMDVHTEQQCQKRIMPCPRARLGCTWMDEAHFFDNHIEQCPFERLAPQLTKLTDRVAELQNKCKKNDREMSTYETRLAEEAEIRAQLQEQVRQKTEEAERSKSSPPLDSGERSGPEHTNGSPNTNILIEALRSENEMLQDSLQFMALPKFTWIIHKKDAVSRKMQWSPKFLHAGFEWQLRFVASEYPELYLYTKSKLASGKGLALKCRLFILHNSQHSNKHLVLDIMHRFEKRGACGDKLPMKKTSEVLDQRNGFIHVDGCLHVGIMIMQMETFETKNCVIM